MSQIKDLNIEELKTYCGQLMSDLRGSWSCRVVDRMVELRDAFEELCEKGEPYDEDQISVQDEIDNYEYGEFDGRIFRNGYNLYSYKSEEGSTVRVKNMLNSICEYPEYLLEDVEL